MSLSSALCKLFRFLANTFSMIVNTVAEGVKVLGAAVVDVLSDLASAVGDAVGLNGSTVLWIGVGVFAFLLFRNKDDEKDKRNASIARVAQGEVKYV